VAKKRILFCGEASWLSTGFAKFNREILKRLHKTGKYELAEMGSYGNENESQARALPWKFYGVTPNNEEEAKVYKSNPANAFGVYKYDSVVLDFQPDIVFDARDPWMFAHLVNSKLRPNYKLFLVPTVDSAPQRKEWVDTLFKKADVLTTYSRFGKKVLELDGLRVADVTSPAVDLETFRPMDKKLIRDKHCIKEDLFIFGTVMRNQRRKLFPDLFTAYAAFRHWNRKGNPKAKKRNVEIAQHSVLLCHTSWPDVGWDLPDLLWRMSIQRHVIFTYKCEACKNVFTSWFIPCDNEGNALCRICGEHKAHMPTTHRGVSEAELAEIYNLMDVYVHPAICEGWGLPITEAKACGIPGLYQNYSAMEDHVENGGGLEIPVGRFYHEAETMAIRSLPDLDKMRAGMELLAFDEKKREKLAREARECAVNMHHWDITASKIEKILDETQPLDRANTWDSPPRIREMYPQRPSPKLTDEQFVYWCYINILNRKPDEKGFKDWMTGLKQGRSREDVENFFRNEIYGGNALEEHRWKRSMELRGVQSDESEEELVGQPLNGVLL
jgi:glycosyltransferase involved in cell wall biosynthesis